MTPAGPWDLEATAALQRALCCCCPGRGFERPCPAISCPQHGCQPVCAQQGPCGQSGCSSVSGSDLHPGWLSTSRASVPTCRLGRAAGTAAGRGALSPAPCWLGRCKCSANARHCNRASVLGLSLCSGCCHSCTLPRSHTQSPSHTCVLLSVREGRRRSPTGAASAGTRGSPLAQSQSSVTWATAHSPALEKQGQHGGCC